MNNKNPFLDFLGICCIFSIFLDRAIRGAFAFDLYYSYIFFLLFLTILITQKGRIVLPPRWFMRGIAFIFACSLFILLVNDMLSFEYWKQVLGILFTSIVYYNVLFYFNFDIKRIFRHYLRFAYWVALFGVIDNILHIAGIHIMTTINNGPFQYREYSIMGEPFYLALALAPAVSYYLIFFNRTWSQNKKQFIIILLCYLLTYSSIAVAGLGISVFLSLYFNDYFNVRKNKLILAPILFLPALLLVNFLIDNVDLINSRFSDTTELFLSSELKATEAGSSNASTFALYSNYIIARDSFLKEPLFGYGLGSHPLLYQETFLKYFSADLITRYGTQNQQDANSKFLRLMSETGIIGLFLFLFAFCKFFISKRKIGTQFKEIGAINYSIFVYILLCLIRNGNYINIGFFFFFFIYYLSWKIISAKATYLPRLQPTSPK